MEAISEKIRYSLSYRIRDTAGHDMAETSPPVSQLDAQVS